MNLPYIKKYDKNGNVTNPIQGGYFHNDLNRRERRKKPIGHRFISQSKNLHIDVFGHQKYLRVVQHETDNDGFSKKIFHTLPL
jgi:hypothetical protein